MFFLMTGILFVAWIQGGLKLKDNSISPVDEMIRKYNTIFGTHLQWKKVSNNKLCPKKMHVEQNGTKQNKKIINLPNNMTYNIPLPSFKTFVSIRLKPDVTAIICCCLKFDNKYKNKLQCVRIYLLLKTNDRLAENSINIVFSLTSGHKIKYLLKTYLKWLQLLNSPMRYLSNFNKKTTLTYIQCRVVLDSIHQNTPTVRLQSTLILTHYWKAIFRLRSNIDIPALHFQPKIWRDHSRWMTLSHAEINWKQLWSHKYACKEKIYFKWKIFEKLY